MSHPSRGSAPDPPFGTGTSAFTFQAPHIIRFEQMTQGWYAWFTNTSAHPVLYKGFTYPTAAHLFEAMKYIDTRPEVVEMIRTCQNINDVYAISQRFQQFQRPDWNQTVAMCAMEDVLALKFMQHPELRAILLNTENAILKYSDRNDPFWGEGPDGNGRNELGKALMKIRDRIRNANRDSRRIWDATMCWS
ncbi:hypothetical protein BDQ17DRAFT_1427293 [Cyathus striatus]|nr:hypothetical protein BDQ17DRAFT_1427293 [Cyathus striatus]